MYYLTDINAYKLFIGTEEIGKGEIKVCKNGGVIREEWINKCFCWVVYFGDRGSFFLVDVKFIPSDG